MPGWPLPTFCTASIASTRAVSTARWSRSVQSSLGVTSVCSRACASASRGVRRGRPPHGQSVGRAECASRTHRRRPQRTRLCTRLADLLTPARAHRSGRRPRRRSCTGTRLGDDLLHASERCPAELARRPRGVRDRRRPARLRAARHDRTSTLRDVVAAYVGLTKPRIIELLLLTTVPVMFLAQRGVPPLGLVVATVVGGTLSAGSANALNCVYDADIDERMRRTRRRALPRHVVSTRVGAGLRAGARRGLHAVARAAGQLALGRPGAGRERVLRRRLHDDPQAADHPEHRLGRRRRAASRR